jgi:hypothetical protein
MRDELDDLLNLMGMSDLLKSQEEVLSYKDGTILIVGKSEVKEREIRSIAEAEGIDRDRIECFLDYEGVKTYNFKRLHYNPNYRLVMFGSVPHSSTGKNDSTSVINELENTEGYPKVIRLISNSMLKITKSNLHEAFRKLKAENYI